LKVADHFGLNTESLVWQMAINTGYSFFPQMMAERLAE
jgi:hypothetical protein